ncbi:nucleolar transcription factor 1-A-like [Diaphorina citri]|uniref:Nucleolar transcription factor 1-A-like n=1 Tax=Diaphorina citri TaxID=121845 RepID=A0A3Q0IYH8_DIACI|nr:nucleolar transcription factor 1-A-like [Diaphorina citri]KAI5705451.1 hypothetical protein M8J75_015168 [Diaphorina citri]KAI5742448.1 hypothetical protein M8J77_007325 [Diaphorina citri]
MDLANNVVSDSSDIEDHQSPKPKKSKPNGVPSNSENILDSLSQKEISLFLDRMQENLDPKLDKSSYKSGVQKYDWTKIHFKYFTPEQCQHLWEEIQTHQRKFRTLGDLLKDAKSWNEEPKKKKATKKVIEGLPKRPMSSYMVFFKKEYKKMKEKDPTMSCIAASKIASEKFKTLSPHKKACLMEEVQAGVDAYKTKMVLFQEEHPDFVAEKPVSQPTEQHAPNTPRSPFKIFYDEKACKYPKGDVKNLQAKLKEDWNSLDDRQKVEYIHQAKVEFVTKTADNDQLRQSKPNVSKEEDKIYFSILGVPVKPPSSGYLLFSQEYLQCEESKFLTTKERMKVLSEKWHSLTAVEKKEYKTRQKEKHLQYDKDYSDFLTRLKSTELSNFLKYNIVPYSAGNVTTVAEEEVEVDKFPKSARAFFKLKTGQSKAEWKELEVEEKEKWKKKFEKKRKKIEKHNASASQDSEFTLAPPLYNSTPMVQNINGKRLQS